MVLLLLYNSSMFNDKVYFEEINGKKIFCVLSESESNQKKIVIMSHGFRSSSIGPARTFVDFSRILNKNGIDTLRFDQPNCGNSEGDYIDSSFNEWINTTTFFATKYLNLGYKVVLLGQSMGATTTVIASSKSELKDKIPCIILWVPDPKSTFEGKQGQTDEEGGQLYNLNFWKEARDSDFFKCLDSYNGKIHLVYGENDMYVSPELRNKVINVIKAKNQSLMVLEGQDHSSWKYDLVQKVYKEGLDILKSSFEE